MQEFHQGIDDDKVSLAVFIYLAKAFDTVIHALLQKTLKLSFNRSYYLADRKQFEQIKNTENLPRTVDIGVPQETILGQIIFHNTRQ